ncbi:hypothetical protein ACWC5I_33530 [Kitasatospora sp. NPDC001574]
MTQSQPNPLLDQAAVGPDADAPDLIWHAPRRTPQWMIRDIYGAPSIAATTVLGLSALLVLIVLVLAVGPHLLHAVQWITEPAHSTIPAGRLWHTVNDPIYHYLTVHSAGLPAGPRTLFTFWGLAGAVILIRALRQGADATVGVQLGALVFGTLSVAMVWDGTADPGKPVAAGLAALAWGVLAALALTGSWIHTTVINEPPAPAPAAPAPVVPVTVEVPEPRIEAVVVDVQTLQVDINGRRLTGDDSQDH